MDDATDMKLLRQYAAEGSDSAFVTLVARHVNLVYSAALRRTGRPAAAEEITQAVFIVLARKAGRIPNHTILPGWLYRTAQLTAASFVRGEMRRARREQEAYMQSQLHAATPDQNWEQLAPLLDDAMAQLRDKDRAVVVLRFFSAKSFTEVARAVGISENAAKKRASYALEKLRRYFSQRGVSSTTATITGAISANSVQAAPAALAHSVTAVAVVKGAVASSSTLILANGVLKLMTYAKIKTTAFIGTALVVAGVTAIAVDEKYWEATLNNLSNAPHVLIIRPSRYPDYRIAINTDGRAIGHNLRFADLIWLAYSFSRQRIIMPASVPTNRFDVMVTLRSHEKEALQEAIKQEFGFAARRESRETDLLTLTMRNPDLLALHVSTFDSKKNLHFSKGSWSRSNCPISELAQHLEYVFDRPVVLQLGLSGNYDFSFEWDEHEGDSRDVANTRMRQAITRELNQLGLELVPGREPIEMLVVEKVK